MLSARETTVRFGSSDKSWRGAKDRGNLSLSDVENHDLDNQVGNLVLSSSEPEMGEAACQWVREGQLRVFEGITEILVAYYKSRRTEMEIIWP